jgi:hypothetical protein
MVRVEREYHKEASVPSKGELVAVGRKMRRQLMERRLLYGRPDREIPVAVPVEIPPLPGDFLRQVRALAAPIHQAIDVVTRLYKEKAAVRDHLNRDIPHHLRPYNTTIPPRIMRLDVIPVAGPSGTLEPRVNEFQVVSAGQGHTEEMYHVQEALGMKPDGTSLAQDYADMLAQGGYQSVAVVCHRVSAYYYFHRAFARRVHEARPDIRIGVYGAQDCQIRDGRLYVPTGDGDMVMVDTVDRHFLAFALPEGENRDAPPDRQMMTAVVNLARDGGVDLFPAPNLPAESRFFFTLFYEPQLIPLLREAMGETAFEKTQSSLIETYVFDPDRFPLRPVIRHLLTREGREALFDYLHHGGEDLFPDDHRRLEEERRQKYEQMTANLHPPADADRQKRRALKKARRRISRECKAEYYEGRRHLYERIIQELEDTYRDRLPDYEQPLPPLRLGGRLIDTWDDLLSLPPQLNPLVVKEAGFNFGSSAGRSVIMPPKNAQENFEYDRRLRDLIKRVREGDGTAVVQPFVPSPRFPVTLLDPDGDEPRRIQAKLRVCPFILRPEDTAPEDAHVPLIAVTAGEGRIVHGGKLSPTFIPHSRKEAVGDDL